LGIPIAKVQFFEAFVETEISCCAQRFPLIAHCYKIVNLTAKIYSRLC